MSAVTTMNDEGPDRSIAEVFRVSGRALSLSLHLAAGIVLAVVGLELMPEALKASPPWVPWPSSPAALPSASTA